MSFKIVDLLTKAVAGSNAKILGNAELCLLHTKVVVGDLCSDDTKKPGGCPDDTTRADRCPDDTTRAERGCSTESHVGFLAHIKTENELAALQTDLEELICQLKAIEELAKED